MTVRNTENIKNAVIDSAEIEYWDGGDSMISVNLTLNYGGIFQGFGGYCLDTYNKETEKREPSKVFGDYVDRLMKTVGVSKFSDLKGRYVRAEATRTKVFGIGNILDNDKWFYPEELFDEHLG